MRAEAIDRADEGLSASERLAAMNEQNRAYARDVQTIKDQLGGGGSAAASVAGLNLASARADAMGQKTNLLDINLRRQNRDIAMDVASRQQEGNMAAWQQQYNNTLNSRDAYAKAMMANLQNIGQAVQYNQNYGQGSPYYNLMLELAKQNSQTKQNIDAKVKL